jgi:hypothetical protein
MEGEKMRDVLAGDIIIDDFAVRFSDRVGKYVTNEQVAVLHQTAERLGKVAVQNRYPTDPDLARGIEMLYGWKISCSRNEFDVPHDLILSKMKYQLERMGEL